MPPFGKNVHIEMTSWLPTDTDQAQAVNADKDYELAFLYAEYRGGQDQSWENYVSPVMKTGVQQSLQATDVNTESFTGTIKYLDMSAIPHQLGKARAQPGRGRWRRAFRPSTTRRQSNASPDQGMSYEISCCTGICDRDYGGWFASPGRGAG
jgi:hypothetical protein